MSPTSEASSETVALDERTLCVEVAGDPGGMPVLVCAGTPSSRRLYPGWIEDACAQGIRLIGYDRPGYGGSDPHPGQAIADAAADVRAIAAALGIDRLAVWGYSGGGPCALACAALAPELVVAAATIGAIGPYDAPGLDFFTDMGEENRADTRLFFDDREAWRRKSERERDELMAADPDGLADAWATLLSPADAAVLTGGFGAYFVATVREGLRQGAEGWCDDAAAHLSSWGFDVSDVRVPVRVAHGRQDRFVGFQHGRWLATHVPGAQPALSDTDGHLTLLVDGISETHAWLLGHF